MGANARISLFRLVELVVITAATVILVTTVATGKVPKVGNLHDNDDIYYLLMEMQGEIRTIKSTVHTLALPPIGTSSATSSPVGYPTEKLDEIYDQVTGSYGDSVGTLGLKLDIICWEVGGGTCFAESDASSSSRN